MFHICALAPSKYYLTVYGSVLELYCNVFVLNIFQTDTADEDFDKWVADIEWCPTNRPTPDDIATSTDSSHHAAASVHSRFVSTG